MKSFKIAALSTLIFGISATSALAQNSFIEAVRAINGKAAIMGQDSQILGLVSSDQYNSKSICNRYGNYGSPYSSTSVLNRYGNYGSPYSDLSAYNPTARKPPMIVIGDTLLPLTKNPSFRNRVDPDAFIGVLCGGN